MRLFLFMLFFQGVCYTEEVIGIVLATQGEVTAKKGTSERILERGDSIYLNDWILVGPLSRAQLKLTDGTLFNLIPNSEYQINLYMLDARKEQNAFAAELVRGGLRGVTGTIAKMNPNAFTVRTPNATLGIRGTIFEIKINEGRSFFGCEVGEISVTTLAGSVVLGPRSPHQFSAVKSEDSPPQTLPKRPTELRFTQFVPPTGICQ